MDNMESHFEKVDQTTEKMNLIFEKTGQVFVKAGHIAGLTMEWIWKLRKFIMAVPIIYASFYLARLNANLLPSMVGINLQVTGEYTRMISRGMAINGPLAITAVCLLFMFLSRKTLYPWLISVMSLVLPLLLLLINVFPA